MGFNWLMKQLLQKFSLVISSFEAKIVTLTLLAVTIPLGLYVVISAQRTSQALTEAIGQSLEDKAVLVARGVDQFVNERIADARIMSQADVLEHHDTEEVIQYLTEIVEASDSIDDVDVTGTSGRIIASSGEQNEQLQTIWELFPGTQELFDACRKAKQGEVFVSEAQALDSGPGLLFLTPITDDTNSIFIGALALEVSLNSISRITTPFDEGIVGEKFVYIVDNQGAVLVTEDPSIATFDQFPDLSVNPNLLTAFSRQGDIGNTRYVDISGDDVLAGYADMGEFGVNQTLDWSIIAIAPLREITLAARETRGLLVTWGLIIGTVAMIALYFLIRGVSRSLRNFADQAILISGGDFTLRLKEETEIGGAIGSLASAFNKMAGSMDTTMRELRENEENLLTTLDSIADAVISTDVDGNIVRMNPVAELYTGWKAEDAQERPLGDVFNILTLQKNLPTLDPVKEVLKSGTTAKLTRDEILISKDGVRRRIADSAAPVFNADGRIDGVVLVFRDVTEEYATQARVRQQQKLESIGTLASGVAHEINNPVASIINYAQLIDERLDAESPLREFAAEIKYETERVAEIVKNLLSFARQEKELHSPASINTIVENTLSLIRTIIGRDQITLDADVPDSLPMVKCRSQQIQQVLMNLLTNGRDALNARYATHDPDKVMSIRGRLFGKEDRRWIRITVEDHGIGIPAENTERIFDPFFTTKERTEGTGLGLSISHGIVQDHHGELRVESKPGEYTRFHLELPVDNGWTLDDKPHSSEGVE
jgi:PAS domain S-box-containing protein